MNNLADVGNEYGIKGASRRWGRHINASLEGRGALPVIPGDDSQRARGARIGISNDLARAVEEVSSVLVPRLPIAHHHSFPDVGAPCLHVDELTDRKGLVFGHAVTGIRLRADLSGSASGLRPRTRLASRHTEAMGHSVRETPPPTGACRSDWCGVACADDGSMPVLPDILAPDLDVVFCGTAVATASASRGHYFAGPRNAFWSLLHGSGFTPGVLNPEEDETLPQYGVGITDLVKEVAQSHDRGLDYRSAPDLERRLAPFKPRFVAFAGLTSARKATRVFGTEVSGYGLQAWSIGSAQVFVVPNPSAADAAWPKGGRTKLAWWTDLHELVAPQGSPSKVTRAN